MKTNNLLTVTAVLMLFFGTGFSLIPRLVFSIYGVTLDPGGVMLARVAGAAVIALGVLAWVSRDSRVPEVTRVAVLTLGCFFTIKSATTLYAQLTEVFNVLGWTILLIDLPLAWLYVRAMLHKSAPQSTSFQ